MSYFLSVDLGTTYSAAALNDDGRVEIFQLGSRTAIIPSVVALRADGTVLTGEAADRRGVTEPTRVAREFKRRLGDPTPMVIGGTPYGAETLMADLLRAIIAQVTEQEAGSPSGVVLSHPANYGPYKLDLLAQVGHLAEVDNLGFIPEPEAAAIHYLDLERIEPGEVVAVYDLGGGTFDAALVRRTDTGFEPLGTPDGMERFGGVDLDEAVFDHVRRSLGRAIDGLDPDDPAVTSALVRLREDCREAKEGLSSDTDAAIPVMLPDVHTEVRLTREEFEDVIRPRLRETITMLDRVVRSAGLEFDDLSQVLLVGGSSRIPLVAEMVAEATRRPIGLGAHPKHAIALGAATAGEAAIPQSAAGAVATAVAMHEAPTAVEEPVDPGEAGEPILAMPEPAPELEHSESPPPIEAEPETPAPEPSPSPTPSPGRRPLSRRGLIMGIALLFVAAAVIGTVFLLDGVPTETTVPQEEAGPEPASEASPEPLAEIVVPMRIAITNGDATLMLVGGATWTPNGPIDVSGPDVDTAVDPNAIIISRLSDEPPGSVVEALFEVTFHDVEETIHFILERSDPNSFVEINFPASPQQWGFAAEGEPNPVEFQVSRQEMGG